jgi:hypothetical protein
MEGSGGSSTLLALHLFGRRLSALNVVVREGLPRFLRNIPRPKPPAECDHYVAFEHAQDTPHGYRAYSRIRNIRMIKILVVGILLAALALGSGAHADLTMSMTYRSSNVRLNAKHLTGQDLADANAMVASPSIDDFLVYSSGSNLKIVTTTGEMNMISIEDLKKRYLYTIHAKHGLDSQI